MKPTAITPEQFSTFGELLKYLRRRTRITQRDLAIAVGYSDTQISRMEQNQRVPDPTTLTALFVPALYIEQEPKWVMRLLELAKSAHIDGAPETIENDKPAILHNLHFQLTRFIGREKEIAAIKQHLYQHRLVTLTGSGGVGKTRLSLQIAADLLDKFRDGVWLVELAPLANPELIPQNVLTALGIKERPGEEHQKTLENYLRNKNLLLVLDNCEHLIDAIAKLTESILQAAPNIKVLATSREALGVPGETTWRVPSLSLPNPKQPANVETLIQYESANLFVDRAQLAEPNFTLTKENASFLAQICYRLDGIPLALELAAARMKSMSIEQIASRLDDRFRLLTGGARTALPRQQTLRALVDWSYDLLSKPESFLLRRLSVFMGGWTLQAAEAICAGGGIESQEVLDLLDHLVNKSLVVVGRKQGKEIRYQLLETIRQYVREKLFESGEGEKLRQQHADWFLKTAEQARQEIYSPDNNNDEIPWLNRLESDHDNFRAALEWLFGTEQIELGTQLAFQLDYFWWNKDHIQEGRYWLEAGLSHPEKLPRNLFARTLDAASLIVGRTGNYEKGISYSEQSVAIFRELGKQVELAGALHTLAIVVSEDGDDKKAKYLYLEALTLNRDLGNKREISTLTIELGWTVIQEGEFDQGFSMLDDGIRLKQELGNLHEIAYAQFVLGICRWIHHEPEESEKWLIESLRTMHELEDNFFTTTCIVGLAGVASSREQFTRAAQLMGAADSLRDKIQFTDPPFWIRDIKGPILESIHAQLNKAKFDKAWNKGYAMDLEKAIRFALND